MVIELVIAVILYIWLWIWSFRYFIRGFLYEFPKLKLDWTTVVMSGVFATFWFLSVPIWYVILSDWEPSPPQRLEAWARKGWIDNEEG